MRARRTHIWFNLLDFPLVLVVAVHHEEIVAFLAEGAALQRQLALLGLLGRLQAVRVREVRKRVLGGQFREDADEWRVGRGARVDDDPTRLCRGRSRSSAQRTGSIDWACSPLHKAFRVGRSRRDGTRRWRDASTVTHFSN